MNTRTTGIVNARREDSARRRQRVIKALNQAVAEGEDISISGIARRAGVDRAFLYRHRDLHEQVLAQAAEPPTAPGRGPSVSRQSLRADLANARGRISRLSQHNSQLEKRLSEVLGEAVWRETGLGAPDDIDALHQRIAVLEQTVVDLRWELGERTEELQEARTYNRELMARLNAPHPHP